MFDGILCWNQTMANERAYQTCPDYIVGFNSKYCASIICLENGEWQKRNGSNKTYTNYEDCIKEEIRNDDAYLVVRLHC
jgi:calcitonin receptor-like